MGSKPVAAKLGVQAGDPVLLLNAPEGYQAVLGTLPEGLEVVESSGRGCDIVQVFVRDQAMFDEVIHSAFASTDPGGRLWVTYPKKSSNVESDLSRDVLAELMDDLGWWGTRQIAVDDPRHWNFWKARLTGVFRKFAVFTTTENVGDSFLVSTENSFA